MRLEAMAVKIPHVEGHPNKVPFVGVLTVVNTASDKAPAGARGHRVMLTREAAEKALPSLLGMAVDLPAGVGRPRCAAQDRLLTEANLVGQKLVVKGYLYARDFPEVAEAIEAQAPEAMGMSYELADARVEDMRAEVWKLTPRDLYRGGDPAAGEGRPIARQAFEWQVRGNAANSRQ